MSRNGSRRVAAGGFTLVDLTVTIACLGLMLCLLAAGLARSRVAANLALCSARLGGLGAGSARFAQANKDLFVGFTWQQGGNNSQFPELNQLQSFSPVAAHAAQATDLFWRRGRTDIAPNSGWIPEPHFWSLPLVEFEGRDLTDIFNVCPSDDQVNKWRRHPAAFNAGAFGSRQPNPGGPWRKEVYRSSYTISGATIDRLQSVLTPSAIGSRLGYAGDANLWSTPHTSQPGPSAMSLVAFPSQKAHAFDSHDRHFAAAPLYFGYDQARGPVLFFDGSVRVHTTSEAVTPWQPNNPGATTGQSYVYEPWAWQPPTLSGQPADPLVDRYRWTRDGLLGRDFAN